MMVNIVVGILLLYESLVDIIKLKINIIPVCVVGIFGFVMNFFVYKSPVWWLTGMLAGLVLLLAALISGEKIGYGDGMVFLMLGACVEPLIVLWVLWLSMLAAGIAGGVGIFIGKKDRKGAIPYIPFVLAAYIIVALLKTAV